MIKTHMAHLRIDGEVLLEYDFEGRQMIDVQKVFTDDNPAVKITVEFEDGQSIECTKAQ